jgi:hypothetical protein
MVRVAKARDLPKDFEELFNTITKMNPNTPKNEAKILLHQLVEEYSPQLDKDEISTRELQ